MEMTFDEFMRNLHAQTYRGTDDDMPDDFDRFVTNLQADDWMLFGQLYGNVIREDVSKELDKIIPKK